MRGIPDLRIDNGTLLFAHNPVHARAAFLALAFHGTLGPCALAERHLLGIHHFPVLLPAFDAVSRNVCHSKNSVLVDL